MAMSFCIATWNVERSGVQRTSRIPRQLDVIREKNADLWVLTETHSAVAPDDYHCLASMPDSTYHAEGESCATIWCRWPLKKVKTEDPVLTVCGELQPPFGTKKMLVYGTIIPYGADGVREGAARPWERHREAVRKQTAEWRRLREQYPDHLLCVAGDFNENLDGTRWYGVRDAKEAIQKGLAAAGMRCVTAADLRARGISRASNPAKAAAEFRDEIINIKLGMKK